MGYNFVKVEDDDKLNEVLSESDISADCLYALYKNGKQAVPNLFYFHELNTLGKKLNSINNSRYSWLLVLTFEQRSKIPKKTNCIFDSVEEKIVYVCSYNESATIYTNLLMTNNKFVYLPSMEIVYDGNGKNSNISVNCLDGDGCLIMCEGMYSANGTNCCTKAFKINKTTGEVTKL